MISKGNVKYNNKKKTSFILIKSVSFIILLYSIIINEELQFKKNNEIFTISYLNYINKLYHLKFTKNIFFSLFDVKYSFSFKFKKVKIEYFIGIYNENNQLISPSEFMLYEDIRLICHMDIIKKYININSLANIYNNKYFSCIEYFNIYEKIDFGIKFYQNKEIKTYYKVVLFKDKILNYNNLLNKSDNIFDSLYNNNEYINIMKRINNIKYNNILKLKSFYIQHPNYMLKRNSFYNKTSEWIFKNIYNNFFCFCKGIDCLNIEIPQICKYYFYNYIIDNNRNIFEKTDYLFVDFIFSKMPPDDTYPVFKKMAKKNLPVHYVTQRLDIYNKYCHNKKKCLRIILIDRKMYKSYGDFLEKYIYLLLKLKVVVSGKITPFHYVSTFFYNSEYITYISVGHGVCFFKYFLYTKDEIYGINRNNKILLPPSHKILDVAKKYGWKDKDIIKINLPRWDKLNRYNKKKLFKNKGLNNNSIFIMFTWRSIRIDKQISSYYHQNISNLLNNKDLNKELEKNNITLYFTLHRFMVQKYKDIYTRITKTNKNIKYIKQTQISECLAKTNLIVSDFSSVVFDVMYRRKPVIIYIPDADEPNMKEIYKIRYYRLIKRMKNDKIKFFNKFFNLNNVVKKIIYYINNNFTLETKLKKFYDSFEFKIGNNINKFVKYLKKLK